MDERFDLIVVGGGIGGSSFARAMAEPGAQVLLLERTQRFKDEVRGEVVWPWGVAELKALGNYDRIRDGCGQDVAWFDIHLGPPRADHQDLLKMAGHRALNFHHPQMQQIALDAAREAGVEVRRGALAHHVEGGDAPRVVYTQSGASAEATARLVVCANGKASGDTSWAGLPVVRDDIGLMVAGVLLEDVEVPDRETNYWIINPVLGQAAFLAPQPEGSTRAYLLHSKTREFRLRGPRDLASFVDELVASCAPADWFGRAKAAGPLATFDGTDTWVSHPYRDGVALIGDAAASTDPSYGQGMSLTCRDARVLRDCLLETEDWDAAGHRYAAAHDVY